MTLSYHLHLKPNPITTKWKSRTNTKQSPQANSRIHQLAKYNTHQNHKPSPRNHPHPKLNLHAKQKLNPKNKATSTCLSTNIKTHLQNKCSKNKPHPNLEHHHKIQHLLSPHTKYQPHPKSTMASAYRPHHTNKNKYHFINNWEPNSTTNQKSTSNAKQHFSPIQIENTIPAIPNLFSTNKVTITIYLKKTQKIQKCTYTDTTSLTN